MFRNTSTLIITIIAAFAVVIGSMLWLNKKNQTNGDSNVAIGVPAQPYVEPEKDTLGAQWNWDNVKKHVETKPAKDTTNKSQNVLDFPYTAEEIYNALQQIRIDENGNIVVDHILLWSLNDAVTFALTPQHIADLKELIQLGLPGIAGEQTADLVGKFYDFINARKEFEEQLQTQKDQGMLDQKKQMQEMITLREMYLGAEASQKLFAKSDADTAFMIEAMSLHGNTELNEEQKKEAIKTINDKYIDQTISALNLNEKYELYLLRKAEILADGSDPENQRQAMNEVLQEIFSRRELTEITHLPLTEF